MVYIRRLEIRGFKSIGPRPVTLSLEPGLVVITGPNGSGKSNIIDAILFCLGDSSLRRLRVSRLSSLLHNSGGRTVESCRVAITFDNRDHLIPLDVESVTIARELGPTGESRFYLNGRHVSKNVVDELLANCMLSPGGVWVVPQGTVTRIADLNPDDRRRLLEELAGVSRYDEKKAMALKQLEEADRKLEYHRGQVGIRREQLTTLEEQRNDRLRLKILEKAIALLRAAKLHGEVLQLTAELRGLQAALAEARSKQDGARERLDQLTLQIRAVEEERAKLLGSIFEGGWGPAEASFRLSEAQAKLDRLQRQADELRMEADDFQRQLSDLEAVRQNALQEKARLASELKQKRQELAGTLAEKRSLEARLRQTEAQWGRARRRLEALQRSERLIREAMEKLEARLMEREPKIAKLEAQLASQRERLDRLRAKQEEIVKAEEQLERAHKELAAVLNELGGRLRERRREGTALFERIRLAIEDITHASLVVDRANQWLLQLAASRGPSWREERRLEEALRNILAHKFVGRLLQLITYPPGLESALSAALGPWRDALVLQDMRGVVEAGELARKLRVKGVRLLPMTGLPEPHPRPLPQVEGVLGYLADHIGGPGRTIASALLGDTLLCATPRAAFEAAALGFTGVTKSGLLFEPKGSLTLGGFALPSMGSESDADLSDVLEKLKRSLAKRWSYIIELGRRQVKSHAALLEGAMEVGRVRSELSLTRKLLAQSRKRRRIVEREAERVGKVIRGLLGRLEGLKKSRDVLAHRLEKLRGQLAQLDLEATHSLVARLEDERAKLLAATQSLTSRLYELRGEVNLKLSELRNRSSGLKTLEEEQKRLKAVLSERHAQLQALAEEIRVASSEVERITQERDRALEAARRVQPELARIDEELRAHQAARDETLKAINRLDREVLSLERKIGDIEGRLAALRAECQRLGYPEPIELPAGYEEMIGQLEAEASELRGRVNMAADEEYRSLYTGYRSLSERLNQLEEERSAIVDFIREVDEEKKKAFMEVFTNIDREIRRVFAQLSQGEAWLELEDPDDVFRGGVFLMAKLPGKEPRESTGLSGGERTSAALAFVLAVQSVYPAPLSILDEVDAHLDPVNLQRLSHVLKERAAGKQIIVVTLKDVVASKADLLVGVYSVDGVSQVVRYRHGLEAVRIG